jgi:hypothetical protein
VATRVAILLRWLSVIACMIVAVSFALFVVNQTSAASAHQQKEVLGEASKEEPAPAAPKLAQEGTVHRTIDEASDKLTSPFSGITAGSSSEWVVHGVGLLGALILYGFGLGYLARVIRVRV